MSFHELFQRWKSEFDFEAFISDGIVDESRYEAPHVLFVLRDMNCKEERDLCNDLRTDGSGWKTWNNVARWIIALLDGNKEYPSEITKEKRVVQLKRIAVMNLKKEGGGSRTDGSELLDAVQTQKAFILDEIKLCNPEIIICGGLSASGIKGNATLLKEYVFTETSEWNSIKSSFFDKVWWYYYTNINGRMIPVVEFCHPQVTVIKGKRGHELFEVLYDDMITLRKEFL